MMLFAELNPNLAGLFLVILFTLAALTVWDYREHCRRLDTLKPYQPEESKVEPVEVPHDR